MIKCVVSGCTAAVLALAPVGAAFAEGEYEAPSGLVLSAGDIQVERADLSGGKLVEVPVCISGNSGFVSVDVLIKLDSRLSFDDDHEAGTRAPEMSGVHITEYEDMENTIEAKFVTQTKKRFTEDGEIGFARVYLPEDIPDGVYEISVYPFPGDDILLTYNSFDAWFGSECFAEPVSGSITVGGGGSEQAPPHYDGNSDRNGAPDEDYSVPVQENSGGNETAVTAAVTSVSVTTTSTASTTKKTTVTSTVTSTAVSVSTSVKVTSSDTVTSAAETAKAAESDAKHKRNGLLIPVIIATVIALGTACFIVRKGGRSK